MVWFITTLRFAKPTEKSLYKDEFRESTKLQTRTHGFYMTKENAILAVKKNVGDLNECQWYSWLVIEGIDGRIYNFEKEQFFFTWNKKSERWKQIKEMPKPIKKYFKEQGMYERFVDIG